MAKYAKASEFGNDWEYEKAKRQERKETRKHRTQRRNKKTNWEVNQ